MKVGFGVNPSGRAVDVYTLSPKTDRDSKDSIYNGAENPAPASLPAPQTKTASGPIFSQSVPASAIVVLDFRGGGGK